MCGVCNLWVCVCVGFVMCGSFGNLCTYIYCVLYFLFHIYMCFVLFVLYFLYCIIYVYLFFFDVLLTVHLSRFISVINQHDAQNCCFTISLFHASTCFEHMC